MDPISPIFIKGELTYVKVFIKKNLVSDPGYNHDFNYIVFHNEIYAWRSSNVCHASGRQYYSC